ncbi:MAG: class I SAM-dependent methyltransferase [Coriobacteriia bacterium]|nr:class I SAM-dependent methyltransferase [Coriobacteriia bacterium]
MESGPAAGPGVLPFDASLRSTLERRERLADQYGRAFGQDRVFPALLQVLLEEVPEGVAILEVGAATGLLTRPLLERAGHLTAMEPSEGMLRRLLESDVASSPKLTTIKGMAEDLPPGVAYDVAVVTFTPRRGVALLRLLSELALRVATAVVMLVEVDGAMDWAYLARSAAQQGFGVRVRIVADEARERFAAVMVAEVGEWRPWLGSADWTSDADELEVPFPAPRGAATHVMRYFLESGSRALLVRTDDRGAERLSGNLRTAAHRLARSGVTVRREGNAIQVVRLPSTE